MAPPDRHSQRDRLLARTTKALKGRFQIHGEETKKKLILASAAALVLTGGYANAGGIIIGSDHNDRKVWINTWAGQSEDEELGRRYGSSASTFSGRRSPGASIRGMVKNTHEVWVRR